MIHFIGEKNRPKENSFHGNPIVWNKQEGIHTHGVSPPSGKHQKVPGLVFDTQLPGFNPKSWHHPITKDMSDVTLELCAEGYNGIDNVTSYTLHIHRHVNRDTSWFLSICEDISDKYSGVRREGWGSYGNMYSAGYNVGYKGRISPVAKSQKMKKMPPCIAHSITDRLSMSGIKFQDEFGSKNVGFEEMVCLQNEFWPKNRNRLIGPATWIVSKDLGNPKHVDDDHSRSYAGWFTRENIDNQSAWFLFPDWGVAIELCNDTWISWDGVNCAHCSSVPHLSTSNNIYSLFTAITKKIHTNAEKVNECERLLQRRSIFDSLSVNQKVTLRWVPPLDGAKSKLPKRARRKYGNKHRRWLHCYVEKIENGTVKLRERNKNKRKLQEISKSEVHNQIVLGWVK